MNRMGGLSGLTIGIPFVPPPPDPAVIIDPYWESVVLYTRMEADPPVDLSQSAHTFVNETGGASLDTSVFRFGAGSGLFDGTANASFSTADSDEWNLSNQPFTIEMWCRPDIVTGEDSLLTHYLTSPNKQFQLQRNGTDIRFTYSTTGSDDVVITYTGAMPTASVWYHLVLERDNSGLLRLYVNGKIHNVITDLSAVTIYTGATAELFIGGRDFGTSLTWDGNIDEVRITTGVARYA